MKKKQTSSPKARNWLAVHAFRRNARSVPHPDKKKQQRKRACRGRVQEQS